MTPRSKLRVVGRGLKLDQKLAVQIGRSLLLGRPVAPKFGQKLRASISRLVRVVSEELAVAGERPRQ